MSMLSKVGRARAVVVASALSVPVLVMAQADPFADAVTLATTKVTSYGTLLIGLAAAGVVLAIAVKYVKRIRGAA